MARWRDVVDSEPEFAYEVRRVFESHTHKTIATLRPDGSPRLSGIEFEFEDGDVVFGMMPGSLKARDLRSDPRTELHSSPVDTPEDDQAAWRGDARLSGRAIEVTDPDERLRYTNDPADTYPLFVLDIERVVRVKLDGDPLHLLVRTWRPGHPLRDVFAD